MKLEQMLNFENCSFLSRLDLHSLKKVRILYAVFKMLICGAIMSLSNTQSFADDLKIVTVGSPLEGVLHKKTEEINEEELPLAREIAEKLFLALEPHLPAAGLAAPQIGISKSVFIFSFDRDPKNLEVVINPSFEPIGNAILESWEGCFSVILSEKTWKLAKVPRYDTIRATFFDLDGKKTEKILEGFAAKVFQHEYDHLQGIKNIDREDAIVKAFDSKEDLLNYLQEVKKEDSNHYLKPNSD
jgi:peptide deformylase